MQQHGAPGWQFICGVSHAVTGFPLAVTGHYRTPEGEFILAYVLCWYVGVARRRCLAAEVPA